MTRLAIIVIIALGIPGHASAVCKYRSSDGSWTYAKTCREKPDKAIDESAALVLQRNNEQKKRNEGVEGRRLRGYEYSDTTHSGMRIPMVEPNKGPSGNGSTSP